MDRLLITNRLWKPIVYLEDFSELGLRRASYARSAARAESAVAVVKYPR
jgi:hypothetical protein